MSTSTTRLGLTKPAAGENYSRSLLNTNYDLIDNEAIYQKGDHKQLFKNAGFAWAGAFASWDAGVLSAETDPMAASQHSSPLETYATAGSVSGSIKFLVPGIYDVDWFVVPDGDPGQGAYRIITIGTWPGNPTGIHSILAQTQRFAGASYWESQVTAHNVRISQANLELRLAGAQNTARTNGAVVRLYQKGKL